MENRRELNDILINDDDLQKQNRTKKLMMMMAMALIFLSILIAVIFVITREDEGLSDQQIASQTGLNPMEQSSNDRDSFIDIPLAKDSVEDDQFAKIIDDIKKRSEGAQPVISTPKETTAPIIEKPIEQQKPVLPPKPTPPAPAKPAQPVEKPAQPAKKPEQNKDIANAFENISTSTMDTSKNGQVAEKGFYVQVGSFANKPNAEFLKKISNYSYRVYAGTSNGQTTTKYLIGPYKSRTDAARDVAKFTSLVSNPTHFEVK